MCDLLFSPSAQMLRGKYAELSLNLASRQRPTLALIPRGTAMGRGQTGVWHKFVSLDNPGKI